MKHKSKCKTVRDRLDEFGREGWELVGVLSVTGVKGQTKEFQYYFRRPKERWVCEVYYSLKSLPAFHSGGIIAL
jgi:hypothetical protein